jgi:hypothetical protein
MKVEEMEFNSPYGRPKLKQADKQMNQKQAEA